MLIFACAEELNCLTGCANICTSKHRWKFVYKQFCKRRLDKSSAENVSLRMMGIGGETEVLLFKRKFF